MKITSVEVLHGDAGWQVWTFVKIMTDEGIIGYGECSDNLTPRGIAGCIEDLRPFLVGRDPRPVEMIYWDMYWRTRHSRGGIAQKAIAGIECALWDIKAKALGVPVYELFGGPTRDRVRLYWSHCGTERATQQNILGTPPIRTLRDITELGKEVLKSGFTALKTNLIIAADPSSVIVQGGKRGLGTTDRNITPALIEHATDLIGSFREGVGRSVDIILNVNFNFTTDGFKRMAKAMEPFGLLWLEMDTFDPQALLQIKESTTTPISSGEDLFTNRGFRPYFELRALDIATVSVTWNGYSVAKKIADLGELYEINIAPRNYFSHLATFINGQLCASIPNVTILEASVDCVPWADDIVTELPEVKDGNLVIPCRPGWGTEINEKELAKHPWPK